MKFKYTIIGGGVVGLAIAYELTKTARPDSVLLVEKEKTCGGGVSSRNSEVIHSGIYYPYDSLKHRLCLEGRRLLYAYLQKNNLPYIKCGKMIVAVNEDELADLDELAKKAEKNEVENVTRLTRQEIEKLEPQVNCVAALFSAETGILDIHAFMKALEIDINKTGGLILNGAGVEKIEYKNNKYRLSLTDKTEFTSEYVINSAGLAAQSISDLLGFVPEKLYPCKGNYFYYAGKHNVKHLIYPMPHKNLTGLGTHVTLDLNGRMKFGPDVEYIDNIEDYAVDETKRGEFFTAAGKLVKDLKLENIAPDQAGIRPKIQGPQDNKVKDFYIKDEKDRGFPGFINLLGIESPGLTSSLAIGRYVEKLCK